MSKPSNDWSTKDLIKAGLGVIGFFGLTSLLTYIEFRKMRMQDDTWVEKITNGTMLLAEVPFVNRSPNVCVEAISRGHEWRGLIPDFSQSREVQQAIVNTIKK